MSTYAHYEKEFTQFAHNLSKSNANAAATIRAVTSKRESFPLLPKSAEGLPPMTTLELFESVIYNELWTNSELLSRRGEIDELFSPTKGVAQ